MLLQPWHIKLGLVKNFVKAMIRDGRAVRYIMEKVSRKSEAKRLRRAFFVGSQIRKPIQDSEFDTVLEREKKEAFKIVIPIF